VAKHRPAPVIDPPLLIETNIKRQKQLLHPLRKFRTTRSWPGDLKELTGKSVKIAYGLRRDTARHRHVSPVSVGRNGKYRLRSGDALPESAPAFGIAVCLDCIHRITMTEKNRWHHLFHPVIHDFACALTSSTSSKMFTSSPTATPPVSSALFQTSP